MHNMYYIPNIYTLPADRQEKRPTNDEQVWPYHHRTVRDGCVWHLHCIWREKVSSTHDICAGSWRRHLHNLALDEGFYLRQEQATNLQQTSLKAALEHLREC